MDRPLAFAAEGRGTHSLCLVTVGIGKIAEGSVDWTKAVSTRHYDHLGDRVVPHVTPVDVTIAVGVGIGEDRIIGIGSANYRGPRLGRRGVVGNAEMQ